MNKKKASSIITIICFCTIIFIPIGLVTMWYMTDWKKKKKLILSAALTVFYAGIVALLLMLEPSYNTSGITLPINYGKGETAYETSISTNPKDSDKENDIESKKKSDKKEESDDVEEHLPRNLKRQKGRELGRGFYTIMFFLFMLFIIIWQNLKARKQKTSYENPYVDTNQYKLPLADDARIPTVHFLKLHLSQGEKIIYATETTQKDNPGDFVVTNKRVVVYSKNEDYDFPLEALTAVSSVSNSVMSLICGDRKYYIFMPESQLKYALATVRWAFSKIG